MKGRRIENGRYGKQFLQLTKDFLENEYSKKQKSPYQIAKDVGCTPHTIYTYIDFYKIPRINFSEKNVIKANEKYGLLTTKMIIGKNRYGNIWMCICDCGESKQTTSVRLKNGSCKSCGCLAKTKWDRNPRKKGYCGIAGSRVSDIQFRAKKKNIECNLTAKFLWELFNKQNKKCAISGLEIDLDKNASVDRIDSKGGYVENNVWWTHKDVNKMKMDIELESFIDYCKIIAKHNGDK
jgi:hypothetical protein